jgi:cell division protein FtsB
MSAASSFLERTLGQVDAIARQQRAVDVDTAREEHEAAQLRSTLAELSAASVSARAQLQAERGRLNASIGRTMRAKASVERARAALGATSASNAALVREIVALRDERDRAQQRFVRSASFPRANAREERHGGKLRVREERAQHGAVPLASLHPTRPRRRA